MVNLPKLEDLDIEGKRVMVRGDLDVDVDKAKGNRSQVTGCHSRLKSLIPTLRYLHEHEAKKVIVIGHLGRPGGKVVEKLSLEPVSRMVEEMLKEEMSGEEMKKLDMHVMENLRFNPGEKENDEEFAKQLAKQADVYVNECFSTSHRKHASFVALPQQFKSKSKNSVGIGIRFEKEMEELSRILDNPQKPVLAVISGIKGDKLSYVEPFLKFTDKVLVGGRLPEFVESNKLQVTSDKLVVARLLPDKEDITVHSIEEFENEIKSAGTIILSGPIGKYEEEGHRQGTERVFGAIVENKNAFKIAGGGDTESAIQLLKLTNGFNWISVGGGSMLEYLAKVTLPGIEALIN